MNIVGQFRARRGEFDLDLDFTLPAEGISGIFGPSGSGKTSMLRAIAGLDRHPDGRLEVAGEVWQSGRQFVPAHRRAVGFVFQDSRLFDHLDVLGNIRFGWRRGRPGQERIELEDVIERLDLANLLKRRCNHLSGGERQRVALARALASQPRVLLLDEPLASLDARRKEEILPYLAELPAYWRIPVIYVSHSRDEIARLADTLVLLEHGRVRQCGDALELFGRIDLPLADQAEGGVVWNVDNSSEISPDGLQRLDCDGQILWVPAATQPSDHGRRLARVSIAARDVSLAMQRPQGSTILNILPAQVVSLRPAQPGLVLVQLSAGSLPLLSRITARSAAELQLQPGMPVFAQVKSVAVGATLPGEFAPPTQRPGEP